MTLDAYRIEVDDRIGLSQTYSVTAADIAAEPALLAVGEGGDVQYPTSAYDSRTTGLDFVGTYSSPLGSGSLDLSLAYNYNDTEVTALRRRYHRRCPEGRHRRHHPEASRNLGCELWDRRLHDVGA